MSDNNTKCTNARMMILEFRNLLLPVARNRVGIPGILEINLGIPE